MTYQEEMIEKLQKENQKLKDTILDFKTGEKYEKLASEIKKWQDEYKALEYYYKETDKELLLKTKELEVLDNLLKRVLNEKMKNWYKIDFSQTK